MHGKTGRRSIRILEHQGKLLGSERDMPGAGLMEAGLEDSAELSAGEIDVVLPSSSLHPTFPARGAAPAAVNHTEADRFLSHLDLDLDS